MQSKKPESPLRNPIQTALQMGRALRLVWRTAPRWTLVNGLLVFVQGALPLAALYLMKRIVDAVTETLAAPDKTAQDWAIESIWHSLFSCEPSLEPSS